MTWTADQRARLAGIILTRWWQASTPPIAGHHMGRDLSVCKRLIGEGEDPDELADILDGYRGPPSTLRVFIGRGCRARFTLLKAKHQQAAKRSRNVPQPVAGILRELSTSTQREAS